MANKTPRPDGTARLSDVEITKRFLHPDYELERHDPVRGATGLLQVFSLIPKDARDPTFTARIDDGVRHRRRMPDLDVDISGVTPKVERDFKGCRNGYSGHRHFQSPDRAGRVFAVKIVVPSGIIFEGEVSVKGHFVLAAGRS